MWSKGQNRRPWGAVLLLALALVCAGCAEAAGGSGRPLAKTAAEWLGEQSLVHKDLALYAGQYGPVAQVSDVNQGDNQRDNQSNNQNNRMWHNIELAADGRISDGGSSWEPASISYQPDGTIRLEISEDEYFTIYPEGLVPQMYASVLDTVAIKLEYTDFRDGVLQVLYYRFE